MAAAPGPLALVGGDELNPGNEPQDRVLVAAAAGGPAYVLATAAARYAPDRAVDHAVRWFAGLGLEVRELPATTRRLATQPRHAAVAREGRFFYLVGGDPGIVPETLDATPLWKGVVTAWANGAALAGSSAGAMALGAWTLVRERHPGDERRRFAPALGLVPGLAVIPHFDTFGAGWVHGVRPEAARQGAVLVGIDERTATVWLDGDWRALGPGGVTVIRDGESRRFGAGERVEGLPQPSPNPVH